MPRHHRKQFQHQDAYKLLVYQADDDSETEIIWNSRDGIVPFMVRSAISGKTLVHLDWNRDERDLDYQPKPGERIFVGGPNAPRLKTITQED